MERRIYGIENEFGVTCTLDGQRRLSPDEVARYLFRKVVDWGRSSNVFLVNGARLYLDVGSHPEYATPECDSVHDVVAHEKAGERILEQLIGSQPTRRPYHYTCYSSRTATPPWQCGSGTAKGRRHCHRQPAGRRPAGCQHSVTETSSFEQ